MQVLGAMGGPLASALGSSTTFDWNSGAIGWSKPTIANLAVSVGGGIIGAQIGNVNGNQIVLGVLSGVPGIWADGINNGIK